MKKYAAVKGEDIRALMDTVTVWPRFESLVLSLGIEVLLLRERTLNTLRYNNMHTIRDLRGFANSPKFMKTENLGPVARTEIKSALSWYRIKQEPTP